MNHDDNEPHETICYWPVNFWSSFLEEDIDHFWMLSVFQTVLGEQKYRTKLLSQLLFKSNNYFGLEIPSINGNCYCLNEVKALLEKAKSEKKTAFITYIFQCADRYSDNIIVHYVMIIFNPKSKSCFYVDPRGPIERSHYHTEIWKEEYRQIVSLFKNYNWINVITSDLQALSPSDNFCRTWTLLITYYIVCNRVDIDNVTLYFSANPRRHICAFLKECVDNSNVFKEAVYFEVYSKTHQDIYPFHKIYHEYFTKLEKIASNGEYFNYSALDTSKKNPYFVGKNYNFIEDFVDSIDEHVLLSMMMK
jgi:hypothetical protein